MIVCEQGCSHGSDGIAQSRTKVAHKTLKPQWNEELHVLVQEPTTQLLRVEMFDHDTFNVKVRQFLMLLSWPHSNHRLQHTGLSEYQALILQARHVVSLPTVWCHMREPCQ